MSLTSVMQAGASGLIAAQTGMRVVSDNIANVGTPGYARKVADQVSVSSQGLGAGVNIAGVRRVADMFLQAAGLNAASDAAKAGVRADLLDSAQGLFGDPSGDTNFFSRLDEVLSAFSSLSDDPASSLLRSQALTRVQDFLNESGRIGRALGDLEGQAETRIKTDVERANTLLSQIDALNADITRSRTTGGDSTGSENIQSQLIDELSGLIDISVTSRPLGGVMVRTTGGALLAGEGAATLAYSGGANAAGYLTVTPKNAPEPQRLALASGEIRGLMDLRDKDLPGMSAQLGEFVARAAEEINRAHNAASAVPAPSQLTGSDTGLDLPTAIGGFTGRTTVAVVNSAGVVQRRVDIDFDAGTMSVDGGAGVGFSSASFLASLNGALGGAATASFTDRALSLQAAGGAGLAVADDPAAPSSRAGRGFSHTFGLNDLVRSDGVATFDSGLTNADPHGFSGEIRLRLMGADGARIRDVVVNTPAGGTMQDLLNALNSPNGGVGLYGAFSLDAKGALSFTPNPGGGASVSVVTDQTARGAGGPSITELFGLGRAERSARADSFSLDARVTANPARLASALLNLSAGAGEPALALGDGRGALGVAQAGERTTHFTAAGDFGSMSTTLSRYSAELGGLVGRKAADAEAAKTTAEAVSKEASTRRQSVEGVNLDEELISLTTYQQAFNASARIIQAASDLYDTLLGMMR